MKIALHSDMHLEGYRYPHMWLENKKFDVLVLAGDIVSGKTSDRLSLVREYTDKPVIFVPGNHEYYGGGSIQETDERLKKVCRENGIFFAKNQIIKIGNVNFVCCTGWSNLQAYSFDMAFKRLVVENGIRDFVAIDNHTIDDMIRMGDLDRRFIENCLTALKDTWYEPTVVVTHFAPTTNHGNDKFITTELSSYFSNDYADLIYEFSPTAWLYGHTHYNKSVDVGNTKVYTNQKGYGSECLATYDQNFIVEV